MPRVIRPIVSAASSAVVRAAKAVVKPARKIGTFSVDTARAHHRGWGKHSVPNLDKSAPEPGELNVFGQVALFPLVIAARAASVSVTPMVYYGAKATLKTTNNAGNLAYWDCEDTEKFHFGKGELEVWQNAYGIIGHAAGACIGLGLSLVTTGARVVKNTKKNAEKTFDYIDAKINSEEANPDNESRSNYARFLGVAGYPIGAVTAIVHMTADNSVVTARETYHDLLAKAGLKQHEKDHKQRTPVAVFLGRAGAPVGGAIGVAYLAGRGLYKGIKAVKPVLVNSGITFIQIQKRVTNVALTDFNDTIANDSRDFKEIYGFGVLGFMGGVAFSPVTLVGSLFLRGVKENGLSYTEADEKFSKDYDGKPSYPDRGFMLTYVVGGFGYASGVALSKIINADILGNSKKRFININAALINPVLSKPITKETWSEDSTKKDKYLASIPGAVLAAVTVPAFYSVWVTGNSIKSTFKSGSSMVNGAIGRRLLGGIASDERKTINKVLGAGGYVGAVLFILPVTGSVFVVRKVAEGALLAMAVGLSPAVAVYKYKHDKPVFENAEEFQKFQNIYHMLSAGGNLPEGARIEDHAYTHESRLSKLRHILSLNDDSLTEDVLNALLKARKKYSGDDQAFSNSSEFSAAIRKVKKSHRFEPTDQIIKDISNFIKAYLRDEVHAVPVNLYANELGEFGVFKGKSRKASEKLIYPEEVNANEQPVATMN
ncbi:hypothetical protein [Legionella shakespearei]|uniref:Uncharacterized protein n=1 Tax=Legionella shakespearei DSM 23087 TaxID=1122169 RepID=A0A0W0Z786_9GAMM|nr:hypothetical protein [Legionella shakespearei]KTD64972.1 hypothetical protein Lsha_0341 [Legionella shakespearei DSM 23087]